MPKYSPLSYSIPQRLQTLIKYPVHLQIAKLLESQAQLRDRCTAMDNACRQLHQELDQMRSCYECGQAENLRLRTEVEHLRKNMRVGEQSNMVRFSENPSTNFNFLQESQPSAVNVCILSLIGNLASCCTTRVEMNYTKQTKGLKSKVSGPDSWGLQVRLFST